MPSQPTSPTVCVVVPAHNEAGNLEALYTALVGVLDALEMSFSLLVVDDGSTDATPLELEQLHSRDSRVGYLRLARNFGLQSALSAGLSHAKGDAVIVMDADLQDDPAAVPQFLEAWREGADVVYAVRINRKESWLRRLSVSVFYRIISAISDVPIPRDAGSFALYDRRVVDAILTLPERNRYLPGLRAWVGFRQVGIPVERYPRRSGRPAQNRTRLLGLAADGLFSFSKVPLRMTTLLGFSVTTLSALALLLVLYWRFIQRSFPSGIGLATIALALLFLGGVQLLMLGIQGEYVGRVYDEVKQRPTFVVDKAVGVEAPGTGSQGGSVAHNRETLQDES